MPPTIPKNFGEVTTEWLSDVLSSDITAISSERIGEGIGLMGDIHRVELTHKSDTDGTPSSIVVKLPSTFEENRVQGVALGMFEAEVRFYAELGEKTGTGLPKIYFSKIQSGTADFVIVMEDLSDLTMVDQSAGMSFEQALAAVKVLANIHVG